MPSMPGVSVEGLATGGGAITPPDVVITSICEKGCGLEDLGGALDLVIPSTCEGGRSTGAELKPCAQSLRSRSDSTRCEESFLKTIVARSRVAEMFSRRFGRLIAAQIIRAVASASSLDRFA